MAPVDVCIFKKSSSLVPWQGNVDRSGDRPRRPQKRSRSTSDDEADARGRSRRPSGSDPRRRGPRARATSTDRQCRRARRRVSPPKSNRRHASELRYECVFEAFTTTAVAVLRDVDFLATRLAVAIRRGERALRLRLLAASAALLTHAVYLRSSQRENRSSGTSGPSPMI
jgi:hypothetical protein